MNSKQLKTLKAVFATPTNKALPWSEIEALLAGAGANITEGSGSRVKFDLNGVTLAIHRPHNPKTARAYQVELVREFLTKAGIKL